LRHIETARQAASALHPIGRGAGEIAFAAGMIGTGLIAVPALTMSSAYAICAAANWPASIGKPKAQTKGFNGTVVVGIAIGAVVALIGGNAMHLLVAPQVLNGLLAPPLLVTLMFVANNRRIMGKESVGIVATSLAALATLIM